MTAWIVSMRRRLWCVFLGRGLTMALTRNDTARAQLDLAIRETLQR